MRAALGTVSWRATQSAPQFLAETSLLLSEINGGTIESLHKVNKLVREMRRESESLQFETWWRSHAWADASQHNRPDRSSTLGVLTGVGPAAALEGEEVCFGPTEVGSYTLTGAGKQWR